ncbi:MAG: hypothetical protein JOS17DRAFT_833705, partial [Linnemannia elongata]
FLFFPISSHLENSALARRLDLISTLLLRVPEASLSDLLKATFPRMPVSVEDPQPLFTPYHYFVVNFSLTQCRQTYEAFFQKNVRQPDERLVDYIIMNGLKERLIAGDPMGRLVEESDWDMVSAGFDRQIGADLTWALCSNAERVRSLTFPFSEIAKYLSIITRFQVLSNVTFHFDRCVQYVWGAPNELSPQELEVLRMHEKERIEHLEAMSFFVQEHRRHHNNVLRTATCPRAPPFYEDCPEAFVTRLIQSLPPLLNLQYLDDRNWTQFAPKVQETDLALVKTITEPSISEGFHDFEGIVKQIPFLHRCRGLDTVHLESLIDDMFQWAVDERKDYDTNIVAGRESPPPQPLVPLRDLAITFVLLSQDDQVNGIAFAFGDTLESLRLHGCLYRVVDVDQKPAVFTIGQEPGSSPSQLSSSCWHVPRLSNLYVDFLHNFVRIHPRLFARSSRLATVVLKDRRGEYSTNDIEWWEPAESEHLESLSMVGTPAISFHPDTLRTTVNLRYLGLKVVNPASFGNSNIPPLTELDYFADGESEESTPSPGRLIWTWDWYLPKLTDLDLTGEFAFRFQFKMLRNIPSLELFSVDIRSTSFENRRTVSVKDLVRTIQDEETLLESVQYDTDYVHRGSQLEYIHLQGLQRFFLFGRWMFVKQVLAIPCSKMVPNVTHLTLEGCDGFDLTEWVRVTSDYLHGLVEAISSVPIERLSREEMEEVRIVQDCTPDEYKLDPLKNSAGHSGRYLFV